MTAFKNGTLKVFDVTKDNYITVGGKKLEKYAADVDDMGDYKKDTHVVWDGAFLESYFRSAPYFDVDIDGITSLVKNCFPNNRYQRAEPPLRPAVVFIRRSGNMQSR